MIKGNISDWLTDKLDRLADWLAGSPTSYVAEEESSPIGPGTLDGTPGRLITRIPPGSASIDLNFVATTDAMATFDRLKQQLDMKDMRTPKQTKAAVFNQKVKDAHKLPDLDADTYKALGATNINLELQPSGHYKIAMVMFDDRSIWSEGGKVHNG